MYSGGMNFESRNQCIADCHAGKIDVLVMQIVCGGVGLNLQMFNKVYMLTPNWNPANEIQAIARCHRIGQTRDVEVFKLVIADDTMETIDQRIIRVQQRKRGIMSHYLNDATFDFNEIFRHENCSKQEFSLSDCMELM
jgi:DNA repair protein RAD16